MTDPIYPDIVRFLCAHQKNYVRRIDELPGVADLEGDERIGVMTQLKLAKHQGLVYFEELDGEPRDITLSQKGADWCKADEAQKESS